MNDHDIAALTIGLLTARSDFAARSQLLRSTFAGLDPDDQLRALYGVVIDTLQFHDEVFAELSRVVDENGTTMADHLDAVLARTGERVARGEPLK